MIAVIGVPARFVPPVLSGGKLKLQIHRSTSVTLGFIGGREPARSPLPRPAFTQAEAATARHYGGMGLGLALSRKFCLRMGGELHVQSELGKGSVFTATLPRSI